MVKHPYASAVLRGAMIRGWTDEGLAAALKIGPNRLKLLLAGERDLSEREVGQIEQTTGFTAGQLAALTLEPNGGPLTELMDEWAEAVPVRRSTKPAKSKRVRR